MHVEGQGLDMAPLIELDTATNDRVIEAIDLERAAVLAVLRRLLAT